MVEKDGLQLLSQVVIIILDCNPEILCILGIEFRKYDKKNLTYAYTKQAFSRQSYIAIWPPAMWKINACIRIAQG